MSSKENSKENDTAPLGNLLLSSGKMKAVNRTSALMAGFAMVAMVELSIPEDNRAIDEWLLIAYVVCTTLLVIVHLLALMTGTYLLPYIEAMIHLQLRIETKAMLNLTKNYVTVAWHCSTIVGIVLFLIEICLLCWVKFCRVSQKAAIASTVVIVLSLIVLVGLCVYYHKQLRNYRSEIIKSATKARTPAKGKPTNGAGDLRAELPSPSAARVDAAAM